MKQQLTYVFTCKHAFPHHLPQRRLREGTSSGTSNLLKSARACDARLVSSAQAAAASLPPPLALEYSKPNHRAMIALRCAANQRPFNMVADELYQAEVSMLRPGTVLPSPATVSRDSQHLYLELSKSVSDYFVVCFVCCALLYLD